MARDCPHDAPHELLVSADQDPEELIAAQGNELKVRGSGTTHQVDALGQFAYAPAFSLPMRLCLEAGVDPKTRLMPSRWRRAALMLAGGTLTGSAV